MKKVLISVISIILIIAIGFAIYIFYNNSTNSKAGQDINANEDNKKQENIINEINNTYIPNNTVTVPTTPVETDVASFSTNLSGDSARLNNISITCNTINGTTIKNGDSFSFNSIVGQPSAEKGYQEADVIVDKKVEKGYGGGNCQVSTTIYNTALQVEGLNVTERHPHKKKVTYIEEGKDAAVAYGAYDFKFKNTTSNTLKIVMENSANAITAKLIEVK